MRSHERLVVWQRAHALARAVLQHSVAWRGNAVQDQARRAAISIAANIVEGAHSATRRNYARFLAIAVASANELAYHLQLVDECELGDPASVGALRQEALEIARMLVVLRRRVLEEAGGARS